MLRMYSGVLRLCASLDVMLQGLICILLFIAIVIMFFLVFTIWLFGHLVMMSFASVNGLSVVTNSMGFLGVQPISGDCKERVTLCSGFSGEKRPEWVIRAKP